MVRNKPLKIENQGCKIDNEAPEIANQHFKVWAKEI